YYGLLAGAFVAIVASAGPSGVVIQRWRTDVSLGRPVNVPLFAACLLLAIVPVLAATASYLGLRGRSQDERQRRRILVVGSGILLALVARPTLGAGVALLIAREFRDPRPPRDPARQRGLEQRVRELV